MQIIISPAKKMNADPDSLPCLGLPQFLPQTERLCAALQGMSYAELKKLWRCNDQIAALNAERLRTMDLRRGLTPAILAYEGIQYRYMAPGVFTDVELEYIQRSLRILSGFYGLLRPFDGVTPYRLEMQARLSVDGAKDLYAFWGGAPARALLREGGVIVNLASREYSKCVEPYLPEGVRFITCIFGEETGGKVVEKGTQCKMARGEMVRYMAENAIEQPELLRSFDRQGYRFCPQRSGESCYVFVKQAQAAPRRRRL